MGWSAPIIPMLQDPKQSPLPTVITDLEMSWIGSLLYVGAIIGPYIPSYLSNIIGRKPCLYLGGFVHLIAIILIVLTKNLATVYAVRIISGLGMGMVTVSNLVYVGEIASTNIRGIFLTSVGIVGISGTLFASIVGSAVSYRSTGYIALIINITYNICIIFIPESPVYYAIRGNEMEAKNTLRLLGRVDDLDNVFESVKGISPTEGYSWKAWIKIFTVKANRHSLFITLSLFTLQQLSGVATVLFFTTTIFESAGSSVPPYLATIIISVTRFLASLIAPFFVERAGRRMLLLVSTAFCALSLSVLGTFRNYARYVSRRNVSRQCKEYWFCCIYYSFLVVYLGQIMLGYTLSWSGPIIPKLQNLEESPLPYLLTETQLSLVGSLAYAGPIPAYIGVALSILFTVAVLSIPESPLFFVLKDKEDKAINNLLKLGRMDERDKLLDTKKEFKSTNDKMDWIELFKLRTNKKALFAVIILNTLQQFSGGLAILFFSASIFEMAGSMINSNISMIAIGCIQLIGSILSPILISRTGTKKLLLISTFVCSVTMFFMGLYFYLQYLEVSGISQVQWIPLAIFTIHFIGYECGFGILPLTLIGEMFTINVRSKGSAVVLSIAWVFGFLISTAFGSVVKFLGAYVMFWFFSLSCVCAFVFTIFCIPETKGKSLLEIQQFLGKKI
ncbi:unnamed protein product, partial [Brenthis ino]